MTRSNDRRRSGILVPLFSCPSTASWGVGDIGDLPLITAWLAGAGQRVLQLLPLNEMAFGQQSPYSAITAMAIDPLYIRVPAVEDFAALGGERGLSAADRAAIDDVRRAPRVAYAEIRRLKHAALTAAYDRFVEAEWRTGSRRAAEFSAFVGAQDWWLDDYALFRALHEREAHRSWTEWPEPVRQRDPDALDRERRALADPIRFYQYLQWLAATQWQHARGAARADQVALFGDLPFMVDGHSADVWAHQALFRLDVSVGVPPDAFSATGQDWGMPLYRWDVLRATGFQWLHDRARRSADLFDGYRVDHLVGFYRTYGRPRQGGDAFFSPAAEEAQREQGERVLTIFREAGSEIIAEDLGTVPDFVRESLDRLAVPGYRVLRWERLWHAPAQPFRDVSDYPAVSVATSGTHDTEPLATWWDSAPAEERMQVGRLPTVARLTGGADPSAAPFDDALRDTLLETLFASGSDLLLLPIQDVFGWRDRINEPATVSDDNWTFKLPWPSDRLDQMAPARERSAVLRSLTERYGRR
jgi:4-alpha-glucanotransferase